MLIALAIDCACLAAASALAALCGPVPAHALTLLTEENLAVQLHRGRQADGPA